MPIPIRCPGCPTVFSIPEAVVGKIGHCRQCGCRFQLTPPLGVAVGLSVEDEPESGDDEGPDAPVVIDEKATPGTRTQPLSLDDDEPPAPQKAPTRPARPNSLANPAPGSDRVRPPTSTRNPTLLIVLALGLFLLLAAGTVAGGVFLVRSLVEQADATRPGEEDATAERPAENPAPPTPPSTVGASVQPGDTPGVANSRPVERERERVLRLPGPVSMVVPGGGGRYLVLVVPSTQKAILYDAVLGKAVREIQGVDETNLVAAGRQKLFIGRTADARLTLWDLRTARQEAVLTRPRAQPLQYLAMGAASDGPLVMATHAFNAGEVILLDPTTGRDLRYPVDDPSSRFGRAIPFRYTSSAVLRPRPSADGRVLAFGNGALVREGERFRGLGVATSMPVLPSTDGLWLLNRDLFDNRGMPLAGENRPGFGRRFLPATSGPFSVAVEHNRFQEGAVKLALHLNGEGAPLGPLPGAAELAEWVAREPRTWLDKVDKHLFFIPDPGVLAYHPPGASLLHLLPVDLAGLLDKAGRLPQFTSLPPAEVFRGRAFEYQATGQGKAGALSFSLGAGPPGMVVTPDGRVTWTPDDSFPGFTASVKLVAREPGGREAVQTFQLLVSNTPPANPGPVVIAPPNNPFPRRPAQPPVNPPAPVDPPVQPAAPANPPREIALPGSVASVAVGGAGRFVILHVPQQRKVAVFDVKEGKVVKYLPAGGNNVRVAAGAEKLFVVSPDERVVQRWDLKTLEKEATAPLPVDWAVRSAVMGSASAGPLWLAGTHALVAVDPKTFKPLDLKWDDKHPLAVHGDGGVRVSADGKTLGQWGVSGSPSGLTVITLNGTTLKAAYEHTSVGHVTPGPDGRVVYTAVGRFTAAGRPIGKLDGENGFAPKGVAYCFPAAEGADLYLNVTLPAPGAVRDTKAKVGVHWAADGRALADLPDVSVPANVNHFDRETIGADQRLMLIPSAGVLVALGPTDDRLLLYRFDLDALLDKTGKDYLLVSSPPPAPAVRGRSLAHQLTFKSKKGGVKVKLDGGPDGMTVSPDGKLAWAVPADFADGEVSVILTVSDASGQEVLHTLRIEVGGDRGVVAAAPGPKPDMPAAAPMPNVPPKADADPPANPPVAAAGPKTINLPGSLGNAVVGGGGRFLILHLPKERKLAIFDVKEGKVVKYLPVAEDSISMAAGQDHLIVALPGARVFQRWSLKTFEREAAVPQPIEGTVGGLCMGSASKGPLLICPKGDQWGTKPILVNPVTLKAMPGCDGLSGAAAPFVRASADGSLFAWREGVGGEPHSVSIVELKDGKPQSKSHWTGSSLLLPAPDGRFVYCGEGVFTREFKKLYPNDANARAGSFLPAASGNLFMQLEPADNGRFPGDPQARPGLGRVHFFLPGQYRPFASIKDVEGIRGEGYPYGGVQDSVMHDKRVHLFPESGSLVVIPATNDKLVVYRFNLDDLLAASGVDYLLVTSEPPGEAIRGRALAYAPAVRSKKGGVKVKLESGPDGMKVVDGKLTWAVPASFSDKDVDVILTVSDSTGQEVFQTFKLSVRDSRPDDDLPKAPAGGPPPEPPAAVPKSPAVELKPAAPAVPPKAPAAGDLGLRPAPLQGDEQTVNLPSSVGHVAVGGGGRFLILHLPKERKLAVFDTAVAKVVKYLPMAEDEIKFAANQNNVIVLAPGANVIQRWSLKTFEREVTVPSPIQAPVKSLTMGAASDGPLVVVTKSAPNQFNMTKIILYNARTFKESELTFGEGGRGGAQFHPQYPPEVRVSGNGELITAWVIGLSPAGVYLWSREGKVYKPFHEHDSWGSLLPSSDGRTVLAQGRMVTSAGKPVGPEVNGNGARGSTYLPAVQGSFYLALGGGGDPFGREKVKLRATVHLDRDTRPLATLPELTGLESTGNPFGGVGSELDQRVFLIPDAKLLVVLPEGRDRLILHRFDLDALLEKSGVDYLFVTSRPPSEAVRGSTYTYLPSVRSKKGGVKVRLESGPNGMKLTSDGKLTWAVPAGFEDREADVILLVSDASGQEAFHTFKIALADDSKPPANDQGADKGGIRADKLVGRWEPKEAIPNVQVVQEFTRDGKLIVSLKTQADNQTFSGTYSIRGNKIDITLKVGGKEEKKSITINRLTDSELEIVDENGKREVSRKLRAGD